MRVCMPVRILAIETSCDETAAAVCECGGALDAPTFEVKSNAVHSQVEAHREFGGVVPSLAKREHAKNLAAVLAEALKNCPTAPTEIRSPYGSGDRISVNEGIRKILEREGGLADALLDLIAKTPKPAIDLIAVTVGPGLEPALWVGISAARALALAWQVPVVGADHMEGHIAASLAGRASPPLPALALLISGGHTELALVKGWGAYEVLGETRDDAVGEAYDKVARILGLPYPGGPEVAKLAAAARANPPVERDDVKLPRPMIASGDLDFSLSGLKTAVLYAARDFGELTEGFKASLAAEFEEAVADVLAAKVRAAIEAHGPKSLIVGGGVIANGYLRERLAAVAKDVGLELLLPPPGLATDNAAMVAAAGYLRFLRSGPDAPASLIANGSRRLTDS